MNWYELLLAVHILGAVVLVGSSFLGPALSAAIRRQATIDSLRPVVALTHTVIKATMPAALVTLAAGLYLAFTAWSWEGWIVVSLVAFLAAGAVAGRVIEPAIGRLHAVLETADHGPVTSEVERLRSAPAVVALEPIFLATDVAIVFMMTNKPGWTGSLTAVVVALACGGLLAARALRSHRPAPAMAA